MNSFGKKILGAFIDIKDAEKPEETVDTKQIDSAVEMQYSLPAEEVRNKFLTHFETLFAEATHTSPGYYEFSKMIDVMQMIADEPSRYSAAFAGLQVQGLSKDKLISSAKAYLRLLEEDATRFQNTVSAVFQEKVGTKREETEAAKAEMQKLSQKIMELQQQVGKWTEEIAENELKIQHNNSGYNHALESNRAHLLKTIDKIDKYIL